MSHLQQAKDIVFFLLMVVCISWFIWLIAFAPEKKTVIESLEMEESKEKECHYFDYEVRTGPFSEADAKVYVDQSICGYDLEIGAIHFPSRLELMRYIDIYEAKLEELGYRPTQVYYQGIYDGVQKRDSIEDQLVPSTRKE